jgi:hypothetical protein
MRFGRLRRFGLLGLLGLASALCVMIGALGSWPGCAVYTPSLLLAGPDAGDAGDGSTGGGDGGTCTHVRWPPYAAQDDDSGTPGLSAVFAMQSIDIGVGPDAGPIGPDASTPLAPFGFDLDNTCTCPDLPSCQQAAGTKEICDDKEGRDHIGLQLFRDLGTSAQNGSQQANQAMQAGQFGMLLQITGYNGQANDRQVSVALYVSNGINGVQDGGVPTALHNGADRWTVDPAYLLNGNTLNGSTDCDLGNAACQPAYADSNAYVTDGVFVANLAAVPLTFGYRANIGGALMKLNDVYIVGRLSSVMLPGTGAGWRIDDGSISGRWRTSDLLANMATIPDPLIDGGYVCGNDILYQYFKPVICALQDITSNPGADHTTPLANCDALSMALAFEAEPARLGPVYGVPPASAGCADAGVAFTDNCP